jgi:hypothetical protein
VYRITFKEGTPVSGIGDVPVMKVPFNCTSDGTIFFDMIPPIGKVGQPYKLPPRLPLPLLTSASPSGEAHSFPLDQIPDLFDLGETDDYASDSKVIFLVWAAAEDKEEKQAYTTSDGVQHESSRNAAEHHDYIVSFDRSGNYQKKVEIEAPFNIHKGCQMRLDRKGQLKPQETGNGIENPKEDR